MAVQDIPLKQIIWGNRIRTVKPQDIDRMIEFLKITNRVKPIWVRKLSTNRYKGQGGEIRYRAVERLGWKTIPADVEE